MMPSKKKLRLRDLAKVDEFMSEDALADGEPMQVIRAWIAWNGINYAQIQATCGVDHARTNTIRGCRGSGMPPRLNAWYLRASGYDANRAIMMQQARKVLAGESAA